jgi:Raf kinase inhibitor-like YbhB/YbcL family protein
MSWTYHKAAFSLLVALFLVGVDHVQCATPGAGPEGALKLTSTAFQPDATIPKKHTCEGQDVSPPLTWTNPPVGTKALVLILDDPDAPDGTWVHWVLYDLPGDARSLSENLPKTNELANGARQGRNDFPGIGYGGPCPPPGPAHRYFFKLYALDAKLDLSPGASKAEVEKAMKGHILREAHLVGRYGRGR